MPDPNSSIAEILTTPSRPLRTLPEGACDCHAHIFGPFDRFPLAGDRAAKAVLAPIDAYWKMLARVGFSRAVVVQPSAYRQDDRALLDALARFPATLRGIAVKSRSVTDRELADLHAAGVLGLRFNELVGQGTGIGIDELIPLAPRLRELGWHAQIYATCDRIAALLPTLLANRVPLVFDHIARVGPSDRIRNDPAFNTLLDALRDGAIWIKLTAYRNGRHPPAFDDVRVFHDAMVETNPSRLLWGSDWPYLSMIGNPPDTGHLLDVFGEWVGDDALRRQILAVNPAALYGFTADQQAEKLEAKCS